MWSSNRLVFRFRAHGGLQCEVREPQRRRSGSQRIRFDTITLRNWKIAVLQVTRPREVRRDDGYRAAPVVSQNGME